MFTWKENVVYKLENRSRQLLFIRVNFFITSVITQTPLSISGYDLASHFVDKIETEESNDFRVPPITLPPWCSSSCTICFLSYDKNDVFLISSKASLFMDAQASIPLSPSPLLEDFGPLFTALPPRSLIFTSV